MKTTLIKATKECMVVLATHVLSRLAVRISHALERLGAGEVTESQEEPQTTSTEGATDEHK